jgi:regulator of cell morphogenesis and NO signaling
MSIDMMQTVGQLAAHVPGATREFEKLGIDYCCGGNRSLGEACVDAKLSVDQVLARLKGWLWLVLNRTAPGRTNRSAG